MKPKRRIAILSASAFLLSSSVLFFIPVFPRETHASAATVLAIAFWVLFAAGVFLATVLAKENPPENPEKRSFKRLFRFFSTKPLIAVDSVLGAAFLAQILTAALSVPTGWIGYMMIFLILYGMEIHCIVTLAEP